MSIFTEIMVDVSESINASNDNSFCLSVYERNITNDNVAVNPVVAIKVNKYVKSTFGYIIISIANPSTALVILASFNGIK